MPSGKSKVSFFKRLIDFFLKTIYTDFQTEVKQVFQSTDKISFEEFKLCVSKKSNANDSHVNAEMLFALLDKDCRYRLLFKKKKLNFFQNKNTSLQIKDI